MLSPQIMKKIASNISLSCLIFYIQMLSAKEICFHSLGCFSLDKPWVSFWRPFPEPNGPEIIDLSLYLFTKYEKLFLLFFLKILLF